MIRRQLGEGFLDGRGEIRDLLVEPLDSVTRIDTRKGAIRGNHWHAQTTQWTYMLSGRMLIVTRFRGVRVEATLLPGQLTVSPPCEAHAWQALEDSTVLVFTRGPRSGPGYESDTVRLDVPLLA